MNSTRPLRIHPPAGRSPNLWPWRIGGFYFAISSAWIFFSDRILESIVPEKITYFQTFKGIIFVLATSLLLYLLTRRAVRQRDDLAAEFRRLIENSSDAVVVVEPNGALHYQNPAIARISGYLPHELAGKDPDQLVHPEDRARMREVLAECFLNPGKLVMIEFRGERKDGSEIVLESACRAMEGSDGSRRVVLNTRDITERKVAERQRESYIGRLKAVNAHIRQIAAKKGLDEILKSIAESAVSLLRVEIASVWLSRDGLLEARGTVGLHDSGLKDLKFKVGEGGIGAVVAENQAVYIREASEDPRFLRKEIARREGMRSFLGFPLRDSGRILGALVCITKTPRSFSHDEVHLLEVLSNAAAIAIENAENLEKLRESYEELQRRQAMLIRTEKLGTIGTMAAGITHEILNPANIIGLHAQRMKWESREGTSEAKSADVIMRNVQRIADICQHFRKFSRDEAVDMDRLDPDKVIQDTVPLFQYEFRVTGVELEIRLADAPVSVLGDKNQLQQVFVNLLNNARDVMPTGGRIAVLTQKLEVDGADWWEARVTDTGPGIPKEAMDKLFDPFFTTKAQEKGTGLGLFISHGIILNHHGKIWAESEPGKGATFIVRLPLIEA